MEAVKVAGGAPAWTIEELLIQGINLISGGRRFGRSRLYKTLAGEIASGLPVLGALSVKAGDVLWVDPFHEADAAIDELRRAAGTAATDTHALHVRMTCNAAGMRPVIDWAKKAPTPRLVIFDRWEALLRENRRRDVAGALGELEAMCEQFETAVLMDGGPSDIYGYDAPRQERHAYLHLDWKEGSEQGRLDVTHGSSPPRTHELAFDGETTTFRLLGYGQNAAAHRGGPDSSVPGIGHTEEDLVTANEKTDDSNA
jgi:AAA domain